MQKTERNWMKNMQNSVSSQEYKESIESRKKVRDELEENGMELQKWKSICIDLEMEKEAYGIA